MKRCVIYTRVSTDYEAQAKSMGNQEALMRNYIEKQGWLYCHTYEDDGITAVGTKVRGDYDRLLADAYSKKFEIIVAKSLTRFSRSQRQGLTDIIKLMESGIRLVFFEDNMDTADPRVYRELGLKLWLAEDEARRTADRIRSTWKIHNLQGKLHACTPPYGYDYCTDACTFIVNEDEAQVVRRIFLEYLQGEGMLAIAKKLTKEGIPTKKGGRWAQATVRSILTNPVYTGILILGKYTHADITNKKKQKIPQEHWHIHPNIYKGIKQEIIDEEIFNQVQRELEKRSTKKQRHSTQALFSGLIKCGECGASFTIKRKKHFRNYSPYYTCITYDHKGKEFSGHGRMAIYEEELLEGITKYLHTLRTDKEEELIIEYTRQKEEGHTIKKLEKAMEKNKKFQEALYTLYHENLKLKQNGELTERLFIKEMERIDGQLGELEQEVYLLEEQLEALQESKPSKDKIKEEIEEVLNTSNFTNLNMRQIIHQITIYEDKRIEVELNVLEE